MILPLENLAKLFTPPLTKLNSFYNLLVCFILFYFSKNLFTHHVNECFKVLIRFLTNCAYIHKWKRINSLYIITREKKKLYNLWALKGLHVSFILTLTTWTGSFSFPVDVFPFYHIYQDSLHAWRLNVIVQDVWFRHKSLSNMQNPFDSVRWFILTLFYCKFVEEIIIVLD